MQGRSLLVLLAGLLTVAAGAAAGAADDPDPDPTKRVAAEEEARRLEGVWEVVYYEEGGESKPEHTGTRLVIRSGRIHYDHDPEGVAYRVTPGKEPRRIDVRYTRNPSPPVIPSMEGVYRREGDRMVLCFKVYLLGSVNSRPTEFRTTAEEPGTLMTLKRVQPKAK